MATENLPDATSEVITTPSIATSLGRQLFDEDQSNTELDEAQILRDAVSVYGGLILLVFFVFSFLRRRYPEIYNIRNYVEEIQTELAEDQFGLFSWCWRVYMVVDDQLMEECGLDAACFVRLTQMGWKLSLVGIFTSIFLLPVYLTAEESSETASVTDRVVRTTIAHVPAGSPRLYATVLAAYIMFGSTMFLVLQEFEWYTEMRHKFLRQDIPRNFSVFVRNIPQCFAESSKLTDFFKQCFSDDAILEASVPLHIPSLSRAVSQRESTLEKLEHALAKFQLSGTRPWHITVSGRNVDSIDHYRSRLNEQNEIVSTRISLIHELSASRAGNGAGQFEDHEVPTDDVPGDSHETDHVEIEEEPRNTADGYISRSLTSVVSILSGTFASSSANISECNSRAGDGEVPEEEEIRLSLRQSMIRSQDTFLSNDHESQITQDADCPAETVTFSNAFSDSLNQNEPSAEYTNQQQNLLARSLQTSLNTATTIATKASLTATHVAKSAASNVARGATSVARGASYAASNVKTKAIMSASKISAIAQSMVLGEEGRPFSSGFVTFTKLSTMNAALQMLQHSEPFAMQIEDAPHPQVSMHSTTRESLVFCSASISLKTGCNAAAVREDIDWLDKLFEKYPGLIPVLEQLAPFLVVVFNTFLPNILEAITMFEGPYSSGRVAASLFTKMAAFMIIQTFFVSAISGSVIEAISGMMDDWTQVVDLLANALPAQGTYFMQIVLISTTTTAAWELFRVVPMGMAFLRRYVGPRLTEKQRKKVYLGLRPLCEPKDFEHADYTSQLVLFYMVLFVFAIISPMTPLITAFCFAAQGSLFRHQFIFIYPKYPDSGGKLWANFIQIVLSCMFVAQITIFGLLGLKKAVKQLPLYIPLMCISFLFNIYIRQTHFRVAKYLPARDCLKADLARDANFDYDFLRGAYVQPQLNAERELQPDPTLAAPIHTEEFEMEPLSKL